MSEFLPPPVPNTVPNLSPWTQMFSDIMPWVLLGFFIVACFFIIMRLIYGKLYHAKASFKKNILLITVPKYQSDKQENRVDNQETIKEQIAVAETLFSTIGGMRADRSLASYLFGRQDHLSFEIVAKDGLISFYVAVSSHLQRYIEQHIHAQYPSAMVEEVSDYNIFLPHGVVVGAILKFRRSFIFPIRTYKEIESDPLSAVTNAMSRMGTNGAAIQIIVRSAKKKWHRYGRRTASELHQGKSFMEAYQFGHRNVLVRGLFYIFHSFMSGGSTKKTDLETGQLKKPHQLSSFEQEMAKRVEEKTSKAGMDANIRIVISGHSEQEAGQLLNNMLNSFTQFNMYQYGNSFKIIRPMNQDKFIRRFIYRHFSRRWAVLLNTEEMASLYHFPLPSTETPNIRWLRAKKSAAPSDLPEEGVVLGNNSYRGDVRSVRITEEDRRRHVYIIGSTGSGKTVLMSSMIKQDILAGRGVCVIDPHGSLAEDALECVPKERANDVIYFDPADAERPMGLNMLEGSSAAEMDFVTQEMIAIFYKLVTDPSMIGPMFEHNMRNAIITLMSDTEHPGTIAEIPRMFTDPDFQRYKVKRVSDPMVRSFWEQEMAKTSDFHKSEMLGYIISKVGRFVENTMMRNIIGQPVSGFKVRDVMDNKKILIVNLSKGKIGEINSNLLGLILVSKLQMAALARADSLSEDYPDFYLYIDEFQNFITDSIATILSEARKYKLNLTMAHQYMGQLTQGEDHKIRDAVLGNVGTMISFRIGVEDAEIMSKQFEPVFSEYDMVNIDRYHAYVRLLIRNSVSRPFDIDTLPPTPGSLERAALLKQMSRLRYGRDRSVVEAEILERSRLGTIKQITEGDRGMNL